MLVSFHNVQLEPKLIAIPPLDGQSISVRLAKKITSSTSTLKRAISRFTQDTLEGTVYYLPATLQWETITDMEELSTLKISSFANAATEKIPITVWSKVIRASSLVKRASEEEEMVVSELAMMNERLIDEHSLVLRNIQQKKTCTPSNYVQGCLNLLHERLLLCETALLCFSVKVHLHHKAFVPNLLLLDNSSYQGSHIITVYR